MAQLCSECGSELPSGAPFGGLCAACLLALGLDRRPAFFAAPGPAAAGEPAPMSAERGSAVLTVPAAAARGQPTATLGTSPRISSETQSLLRGRLQIGAAMICVGLLLFVARDQLESPGVVDALRLVVVAFYGATVFLLRSSRPLSLPQLRAIEVAIVWVVAIWFAFNRYELTVEAIRARDASATLWAVAFSVMVYFAFLSAYGFLAPNTWARALRMTALLAATPLSVLLLIGIRHPAAAPFLFEAQTGAQISSMALVLAIGVMIATWGAHRIHTLRIEAFEARRLGQYRLVERIGSGGMGEVWRAEHRLLVRPAAIKVIRPEVMRSRDPATAHDFLRSFEREAQATASLRSTHTVELYDFGVTADAALYYVMELLDGLNLDTLVRRHGALPAARVVYLLEQACDSLADAHDHGLVHRDIKPANLYVCRMGRRYDFVKVLDFGLVRSGERRRSPAFVPDKSVVVGTPSYVAPEMVSGDGEIDGRADVYSLGCVGYWLLTGTVAFEGDSVAEVVAKHVDGAVVPPSERVDFAIPASLEGVILRCLEKDPAARPQGAEHLAELLAATELSGRWTQAEARAWWEENVPP